MNRLNYLCNVIAYVWWESFIYAMSQQQWKRLLRCFVSERVLQVVAENCFENPMNFLWGSIKLMEKWLIFSS